MEQQGFTDCLKSWMPWTWTNGGRPQSSRWLSQIRGSSKEGVRLATPSSKLRSCCWKTTAGALEKGTRRHAVRFLALAKWRQGGSKPEDIEQEALSLASQCRPPLPAGEAESEVESAIRYDGNPKNVTVATYLKVTKNEVDELSLKSIRPEYEPFSERGRGNSEIGKALLIGLRNGSSEPLPYTLRELQGLIEQEFGRRPARGTVANWLDDLGVCTRRQVCPTFDYEGGYGGAGGAQWSDPRLDQRR